jgi:hypothetical protein
MAERPRPALPGYVRCGVTLLECKWSFEVLHEQPPFAIVTITTGDGPIQIALNQADAEDVARKLGSLLKGQGQASS